MALLQAVYQRDNTGHQDILAGVESLFARLAIESLRPGERILDAFAYRADYLDVTNPFRPHGRLRPALACLTATRLVEVYAARGGLGVVPSTMPSAAWVLRHAEDAEFASVDLACVETVCTRRAPRGPGVSHDVVLGLRDGRQYRFGSHGDPSRTEIIADRIRYRLHPRRPAAAGNPGPVLW
jgi:hypothetical protein